MNKGLFHIVLAGFALAILVVGCTKTAMETVRQKAPFPDSEEVIPLRTDDQPTLSLMTEPPKIEDSILPEYIIDDFKHGIKKWKALSSPAVKIILNEVVSSSTSNTVFQIKYGLPSQRALKLNADFVMVKVRKDARFERYKGICFLAKALPNVKMTVLLLETNQIARDLVGTKQWAKIITLTSVWQQYKINFNQLKQEEYYEQNYIGDDIQNLKYIRQVGFRIDNSIPLLSKDGDVFLDDIFLF